MSRGCGASPVALPGGYLSPGRSSGSFSRRVFVAADDGTLARSDSANRAVPDSADPVQTAKVALACLGHWSDCDVAHWRLRRAAEALLVEGRAAVAARLARKVLDGHAWDPDLRAFADDLERRAVAAGAPPIVRAASPTEANGHPAAHLRNGDAPTWWTERPAADIQPRT